MVGEVQFPAFRNVSLPFTEPQARNLSEPAAVDEPADSFKPRGDVPGESAERKAPAAPHGEAAAKKKPKSNKKSEPENNPPPPESAASPGNLIKIPLIHTNDLHGATRTLPAVEKVVERLKRVNPDAVLVDSGDAGNTANHGDPDRFGRIVEFFNKEGYTAVVPGNHEFQWGSGVAVKEYFKELKARVVSSNLLDKDTQKPISGTVPYFIADIKGVKVGFVGITTTKMHTPQHPEMGDDITALSESASLLKSVDEMRHEGAEVIVALVHKGITDIKDEGSHLTEDYTLSDEEVQLSMEELKHLAAQVPYIDVIVAGHDHKTANAAFDTGPYPHKTYIVEAGSHGRQVGEIDLYVDPVTRKVIDADMKVYPTRRYVVNAAEGSPAEAKGPDNA
ncbi:MAG: metallophosphoesterase [Candidatus Eremiobacteraeota bacterium]|nr:metallophosphoesterase [Candidatus Eremiobacteraeota bacterium]